MSEMSIEYSPPEEDDTELILGEDIPNPNQSSIENRLKTVFELPETETLIGGMNNKTLLLLQFTNLSFPV